MHIHSVPISIDFFCLNALFVFRIQSKILLYIQPFLCLGPSQLSMSQPCFVWGNLPHITTLDLFDGFLRIRLESRSFQRLTPEVRCHSHWSSSWLYAIYIASYSLWPSGWGSTWLSVLRGNPFWLCLLWKEGYLVTRLSEQQVMFHLFERVSVLIILNCPEWEICLFYPFIYILFIHIRKGLQTFIILSML